MLNGAKLASSRVEGCLIDPLGSAYINFSLEVTIDAVIAPQDLGIGHICQRDRLAFPIYTAAGTCTLSPVPM